MRLGSYIHSLILKMIINYLRRKSLYFARQGLVIDVLPSMEEKMCQQRKSISKHTQTKYLYQQSQHHQASGFHQCKMCSSFSSFASSSSSLSSSASSSSSSCSLSSTIKDIHHRQSADKKNNNGCFIRQHWQSMFSLLRREETLKMVWKFDNRVPTFHIFVNIISIYRL